MHSKFCTLQGEACTHLSTINYDTKRNEKSAPVRSFSILTSHLGGGWFSTFFMILHDGEVKSGWCLIHFYGVMVLTFLLRKFAL